MSKTEETLTAVQNIGAAVFAVSILLACSAGTPLTLMICFGVMVVGAVDIYVCELMLDKLYELEERNGERCGNKGKKAC